MPSTMVKAMSKTGGKSKIMAKVIVWQDSVPRSREGLRFGEVEMKQQRMAGSPLR